MVHRPLLSVRTLLLTAAVLLWGATPGPLWGASEPAAPEAPPAPAPAAEPERPPYVDIEGRDSTHQPGEIRMTVFLDFFCSHCHHFDTVVVPVLKKEYGDKLKVRYVGFPIVDPKASHIPILAYYLAEAQGKGEAMKNLMFAAIWDQRMDVTRPDILLGVAKKAGLDLEAFKRGFNENTMGSRLTEGIEAAKDIGARGTPTILIDNHIRVNDRSLRNIEAVFASVLESDG